jgi:protein SCO1
MNKLQIIRRAAWALLAVVTVVAIVWLAQHPKSNTNQVGKEQALDIGGAFTLTNTKGEVVTQKTFLGKPTLMFFGFTHCPEICPTTLADMTLWLEELGADADKINAVFVTVDPERDTPKRMADYLMAFDKRIVGLTGTAEQTDAMRKAFQIYAKRISGDGENYNVDHTATVYLLNDIGQLTSTIDHHGGMAFAIPKIKKLIDAMPLKP